MFAFVFVDNETWSVIAARDGWHKASVLCRPAGLAGFGSEIKQLLDWDGVARQGIPLRFDFLKFGVADHSAETFFDGIFKCGGHFVQLDLSGDIPEVAQKCWYDLSGAVCRNGLACQLSARGHAHLISDVLVGSCLSGGLDNSAIVASVWIQQKMMQVLKPTAIYR